VALNARITASMALVRRSLGEVEAAILLRMLTQ
jgi:hypothetical protein